MSFTHRTIILHGFYSSGGKKPSKKQGTNCSIRINKSQFPCSCVTVSPPTFSSQRHLARGIYSLNHPLGITSGIPPPTPALYQELGAFAASWDVLCWSYSCRGWLARDDQSKHSPLHWTIFSLAQRITSRTFCAVCREE